MPGWLTRFLLRTRATLSRRHDRELQEELDLHLRLLEEEHVARGLDPDRARRLARREFGNPARFHEASRELFSFRLVEELLQDLRYALREVRRGPGFACIAAVSLALGIGAMTSTFALIDAFVLRSLPVRDPHRLIALSANTSEAWTQWPYALFTRLQDSAGDLLEPAAASDMSDRHVTVRGGADAVARVSFATSTYFQVLDADLALGRAFSSRDDVAGATPVAIIGDAFWRERLGGAADVLSRNIELTGVQFQIVGVAARGFGGHHVGRHPDVWIPLAMQTVLAPGTTGLLDDRPATSAPWLTIVARLKDGVRVEQASAAANLVHQRLVEERAAAIGADNPQIARARRESIFLIDAATGYAPERAVYARPLTILSGITVLVLLVACTNFANLMLVRAARRQREFGIRVALGGGRSRLIRQAAIECAVLGVTAALAGLVFARWSTAAALARLDALIVPLELDVRFDGRVLAFVAACVTLTLVFGLLPYVRGPYAALGSIFHRADQSDVQIGGRAIGSRLMLTAQLAMCTVLMIAAGLLFRTVVNLRSQDLGFDRNTLLLTLSPGRAGYSEPAAMVLIQQAGDRLSALPGVRAVGLSGAKLLDTTNYWVDGTQRLTTDRGEVLPGASWTFAAVGPGFFDAVGVPLIAGRSFSIDDARASSSAVVINRSLARFLFADTNPIGRRVRMHPRSEMLSIVGVVSDTKQLSPRDRGTGMIYLPMRSFKHVVLAVRTVGTAADYVPLIKEQLASVAGDLRIERIGTIGEALDGAIAQERLMSAVSLFLAGLALVIGCVGVYALVAHDVARRRHELGVRLALGATGGQIVALVLQHTTVWLVPALAIGLPLGLVASRPLASQLYGIETADPWTLATVPVLLAAIALVAALKPARAASRIDPLDLVRHE